MYPFIEAEKTGKRNVKRACEVFKVSRSAYYQQKSGMQLTRERVDAQLTERITVVHAVSKGTYGAPRVHAELADEGRRHGRKRVARLMRTAGLAGRARVGGGPAEREVLNTALFASDIETGSWDDNGRPAPWPDDIDNWTPAGCRLEDPRPGQAESRIIDRDDGTGHNSSRDPDPTVAG